MKTVAFEFLLIKWILVAVVVWLMLVLRLYVYPHDHPHAHPHDHLHEHLDHDHQHHPYDERETLSSADVVANKSKYVCSSTCSCSTKVCFSAPELE